MKSKKTILLLLTAMLSMLSLAPSAAAAVDGKLADVADGKTIPQGKKIKLEGGFRFETVGTGIECNMTAEIEAANLGMESATVLSFLPATTTCAGFGLLFAECKVKKHTINTPWDLTATPTPDFDLSKPGGELSVAFELEKCKNNQLAKGSITVPKLTLKPETTSGTTAKTGEPIAAIEIVEEENEGEAILEEEDETEIATATVAAKGTFKILGTDSCTYKFE